MMKNIQFADVLIVNPTHYVIALRYDRNKGKAPLVIARGIDTVALELIAIARQHCIYIVENPPLARSLYVSANTIGMHVSPFLYNVLAEMYAIMFTNKTYVYSQLPHTSTNSSADFPYKTSWRLTNRNNSALKQCKSNASFVEKLKAAETYFHDVESMDVHDLNNFMFIFEKRKVSIQTARKLIEYFTPDSEYDVEIDPYDVDSVIKDAKYATLIATEYTGEFAAKHAFENLFSLLDECQNISGILVYVQMYIEYPFMTIAESWNSFREKINIHNSVLGIKIDDIVDFEHIAITAVVIENTQAYDNGDMQ